MPPVAVEALPCIKVVDGYRIEDAPLFVKDLPVGDVIAASFDTEESVSSWELVTKSGRTTIWLLRIAETDKIEPFLQELRSLNCNTVRLSDSACY